MKALALAALLAGSAHGATFKVTLLAPANDERLDRSRLEQAFLGQPGGPAADGLNVALAEGQIGRAHV